MWLIGVAVGVAAMIGFLLGTLVERRRYRVAENSLGLLFVKLEQAIQDASDDPGDHARTVVTARNDILDKVG